jgi:hypothetical protein
VFPFIKDGSVTIEFVRGTKGDPQINGIEVFTDGSPIPLPTAAPAILPTPAPVPLPPVAPVPANTFQDIVINCGGRFPCVLQTVSMKLKP